jgi:hypothetical protein
VIKFLATSDNLIIKPPKFFKTLQGKLKLLQSRLSRKDKRSNNYQKQQVAAGQVIRNRGVELISSTAGTAGMETACAVDLPGARKETSKSRQVAKSRKGATRKPRL